MHLTEDDVAAIAAYARIALTDAELAGMSAYLNDAVCLLEPLLAHDLDGVEPTFHPIADLDNVVRVDAAVPGLSAAEALSNAGGVRDRFFRVPAILADEGVA